MKIDNGSGTPIWISPRRGNGATIIQARSHINLSFDEITHLIHALQEVTQTQQEPVARSATLSS